MYDTSSSLALATLAPEQVRSVVGTALTRWVAPPERPTEPSPAAEPAEPAKRGRPVSLAATHLWLGLLWAVVEHLEGYAALTRYLATHPLGPFAPLTLSTSALLQRLQQAGLDPLHALFAQLGNWLHEVVSPPACSLAPFASCIVALDETKLDAVVRRLPWQRQHRRGDPALLAGKLAALFDLRQQRWLWLQYVSDPLRNCKQEALGLLHDLPWHSLVLFDLGYFSFPFFDYLTERGYWWISRYREKTRYQLLHVYYRHHEILDALVWLGSAHGARAGYAVRLVRFGDGQQVRMYLTNVLDPRQLPLGDIARLYARRWDIELAFLTIKELFGLHHWWSSQLPLILQQVALVLLVAQLVQALRLRIAAEAGCDPFAVSLPLLVEHLPHLLRERQAPIDWVLAQGAKLGLLRPSSRLQIQAPSIPQEELTPLPPDLPLQRRARYVSYKPRPKRPSYNKPTSTGRRAPPSSP